MYRLSDKREEMHVGRVEALIKHSRFKITINIEQTDRQTDRRTQRHQPAYEHH